MLHDANVYHFFFDELRKEANMPPAAGGRVAEFLAKQGPAMLLGAGTLYAGNRLYRDVQAGEQLRQQGML